MSIEGGFQGSLFSNDFLHDSITRMPDWSGVDDTALDAFQAALQAIFERFPAATGPNESQTEDDLIWPVLEALGWTESLRQQNLAVRGRDDVPDGLLFPDSDTKAHANGFSEEWKRYEFGLALVESKRWARPLDRRSGRASEPEAAPSTQMLRYLRRVEDLTTGKLRWGILTNGARWRLYWQGARSVSEQFFELDLAAVLDLEDHNDGLFALSEDERRHWLRVFLLIFRRDAFLPESAEGQTFHLRALDQGRFYEERVAENLSDLVFGDVFPGLARAIADAAPDAPLADVREAALILLYRLLFILYAEDRDLLPVRDTRYDDYGLRERVRLDVGRRKDDNDTFSDTAARYWSSVSDLCAAIAGGDASIGLPPYNGGLFEDERTPLLGDIRLGDDVMADLIDALSFERGGDGRQYINYRDLGVQQLGSIYERLLEHDIVREDGELIVRPSPFARKGSGSYYTPEDLVATILAETVVPMAEDRIRAFGDLAEDLSDSREPEARRLRQLLAIDPASEILKLKICDPAMGSGHFLVSLVDIMADQVIAAMAEAEAAVAWADYVSPLTARIDEIRNTILGNAGARDWAIDEGQLDDRHIIRRMILKRCVYGVDKNPMAVELAKVALWLHTFTVGAPLSFLDHHLRCGDSLFGMRVRAGMDRADAWGGPLLLHPPMRRATGAARGMQSIEGLTDVDIGEAHESADLFAGISDMTAALDAFLSLIHAFEWLNPRDADDKAAIRAFFDGQFGDPVDIALGKTAPATSRPEGEHFAGILERARELIKEEGFFNWEVGFPGVWSAWESNRPAGGFDAVIGNPPWDRMKLQQVEWFAERKREIAMATRAADRKRMIAALEEDGDPLAADFARASARAEMGKRVARKSGAYPMLSGGDTNLYSLFVERAMSLIKPDGLIGLLTPSGIASDKTAAPFFKSVATQGRLKALYDFENRRTRYNAPPFFPDVDSRFKFCAFVASPSPTPEPARCAFFVQDVSELDDPERCFPLSAEDFARVNPNTGTAPIFRTRRDAELTTAIYERLPVLVDRSQADEEVPPVKAWPVRYMTMFHMTNDSHLFRTRAELEEQEGAFPTGGNRFSSADGDWVPLYVGRMIHQYDHRAASVEVNAENIHNAALSGDISIEQKADPEFVPTPQYWVPEAEIEFPEDERLRPLNDHLKWAIAFRDIARATDARTMIASVVPRTGFGNKLPLILPDEMEWYVHNGCSVVACLNSIVLDFVTRTKAHSTSMNWFIVEQLPVVTPEALEAARFGSKTADEIVCDTVVELTYTANDLFSFAKDMGHLDGIGDVPPPFVWDEERRLNLRAKLDAVFFHLYGVTDRDDVRYIYSTFPIVERQETEHWGDYRSRDLCLAWMNALAAGEPDADVSL